MLLSVTISSTQLPEAAAPSRQSTATTVMNIPITSSVVSTTRRMQAECHSLCRKRHASWACSPQRSPFADSDCKKFYLKPKPYKYGEPAGNCAGMSDCGGSAALSALHRAGAADTLGSL